MSVMINDNTIASQIVALRRATGADRFDEVWEGVYMMAPMPNNEHQMLSTELSIALGLIIDWRGLGHTLAGANVSDRRENWTHNYRVPDVLVFLNNTAAEDCDTHWSGGPDFAVEIVSPGDRTLDKLDFYAQVRTRELLIIDRDPWQLTLYRSTHGERLTPVAVSSFAQHATISSEVLPIRLSIDPSSSAIQLTDEGGTLIRSIPIKKRSEAGT